MFRPDPYEFVLELKEHNFVQAILQLTEAINRNTPASSLLKLYEDTLIDTFAAEKVGVFVFHHRWQCTNQVSIEERQGGRVVGNSFAGYTHRFAGSDPDVGREKFRRVFFRHA